MGFFLLFSFAKNKAVVMPLISKSAAGTDKQIQYNDGGSTAGTSTVYYGKTSGF